MRLHSAVRIKPLSIPNKISTTPNRLIQIASDISMYGFLFLNFFVMIVVYNPLLLHLRFAVLAASGFLGYLTLALKKNRMHLWVIVFLFIIGLFLNYTFQERLDKNFNVVKYSVCYIGLSLNMVTHKHDPFVSKILYFFIGIYLFYDIYFRKKDIMHMLLDGSSYNFLSALLLLYLATYCFFSIEKDKMSRLDIWASVLFLLDCVLFYGRGGIITGFIFLGGVIVVNWHLLSRKEKKAVFFIGMICCAVLLVIIQRNMNSIVEFIAPYFKKFETGNSLSEDRMLIWKNFFRSNFSSLKGVLFGTDPFMIFNGGNLHNTFFQLYSEFGLLAFIISVITYMLLAIKLFKSKNYKMLVILFAFSIRASSDKLAFQGFNEPIFFYFVFYYFYHLREKKQTEGIESVFAKFLPDKKYRAKFKES